VSARLLKLGAVASLVLIGLGARALLGGAVTQAVPVNLPKQRETPGWLNPDVHASTIGTTICVAGWTATVRPPRSYTSYLKAAEIRYRHLPGSTSDYEEDHFIPLELGGSPFDTRNLWPESWAGADRSDPLENSLHARVCAGTLTLRAARAEIAAYKRAHG
jgi:hypothetical protein